MSSKRERVRFTGVIRGQGLQAACTGWAIKVTPKAASMGSAYCQIEIEDVPLPTGYYELLLPEGQTERVHLKDGRMVPLDAI
jgi:hypothetical protein